MRVRQNKSPCSQINKPAGLYSLILSEFKINRNHLSGYSCVYSYQRLFPDKIYFYSTNQVVCLGLIVYFIK